MRIVRWLVGVCALTALLATDAKAQVQAAASVGDTTKSESRELISNKDWHFIGKVEMERGDTTIFADDVRVSGDTNHAIATGNVVFSQGNNRIAADRAEFDTETKIGTFYNAYGIANIKPPVPRPTLAGIAPPPLPVGQETDVYFYGETIDKLGPRKYRITNGGFTTCVQPTKRWELSASTVVLNLDHYTMLRSAVFSVKGVPMLYTPILFYPTTRENRSTGVLLPTYGTSTLRGQALHNAFFWAINRSQDATFMHDWYASTGQGLGGEYRYDYGAGSDGNMTFHWQDCQAATYSFDDGTSTTIPAEKSYEIRGSANQGLSTRFRARANVNYFSSIEANQTSQVDIYNASNNIRTFGGNVIGMTNGLSINGTLDHSEYVYPSGTIGTPASSNLNGSWPRVSITRNERPLGTSDLYYSLGGEYVYLLRSSTTGTATGTTEVDSSVGRYDVNPQIRYPFKKWQWFTINTTASWRDTYYSRSYAINPDLSKTLVEEGLNRKLFQFQSQLVGPVFTRVWNTPDNGYAERFKHTIEPFLNLDRTIGADHFDNIVQIESIDFLIGGAMRYVYGINNRFYAKRRPPANSPIRVGQSREIVDVEFSQSYSTDPRSAQYDPRYSSSFTGTTASNFTPLLLSVRTLPTDEFNATVRAEWDSRYLALRTLSATASYSITNVLTASGTWSKTTYIPELTTYDSSTQGLSAQTNLHTRDNRFGGIYSFNYDVLLARMVQQRMTGFYNAQCCGISFEYQTYNLNGISTGVLIPVDRRFFMSFTLAGLGNFSPFNGALGGVPALSPVTFMPNSILVTGAAGFAGSHLVELLARDPASNVTLVAWHRPGGRAPFEVPRTTWAAVDLFDPAAVRHGIERAQPDTVYHCAGAAHVGRSWDDTVSTFATNVRCTHHLLEALRLAGRETRVLIPGSAMVYKPATEALTEEHSLVPPSPYGVSKLAQELLGVHASTGLVSVMIGRAFNHVGARQDPSFAASGFARQIAEIEAGQRDAEVVVGNLDARRDTMDVRDTVRAYRTIAEHGQPARPYNVSAGHAVAIGEMLDMLRARATVPVRVRVDPGRFHPNDLPMLLGDSTRLREELGWTPMIPFSRTLDDLLSYWRAATRQSIAP